ncbi:MAG: hypothetical protein LUH49_01495 [Cloacibacillus porcorum]|uniref:hypothetical protein n=1 Tax=Cloacibacillus porcorum TaxID=1197717 RepID=UPI0023F1F260|nr:hypothetical protein [Cloacibacillus porcorum]MCD7875642.1 hypothetical protein [Cloacibacillus porcorum]
MPKTISLLIMSALLLSAASAAFACAPQIQKGPEKESPSVKGDALALVRVPDEVSVSSERNVLFAALCGEIAKAAGAEVVYVSPIYEDSQSGTAHFKSPLETAKIIERLKKDGRVIGVSPNHIIRISSPAKVR